MSSENTDLVKLKKQKSRYCWMVGVATWCCVIFSLLSYGAFEDSKFYTAPTDQCMFTNASLTLFDCRHDLGCNGLQTRFYYNTTDGTCDSNELYAYSECDCDGNPVSLPKAGNGYQTSDKCWILGCESDEDWTFVEPVNERAEGWVFGILAVALAAIGMFFCCNCLQSELEKGAPLVEEIGEKEAYQRFYETVEAKERDNIPKEWKVLQAVVISSSVAIPVILIGAFLLATYTSGRNCTDNTISEGIQYHADRNAMFRFTEAMTMLAINLASFVSWCRQIQISVYFRVYATFFGAKQAKMYRWWNVVAMVFNVVGYFGIGQLVSYDAARFGGKDLLHGIWAMIAFLSTATFLLISTIITFKQRQIEYRRNIIVEGQTPCVALRNTFWYDAVLMLLLFVCGSTSLLLFFAEIAKANKVRSQVPEDERLNTFAYIHVFTGEWVAFFSFVSGIAVLAFTFQHDHIAWEMHDYLEKEVILWPCARYVFKGLACCCCCCCKVESFQATNEALRKQIEAEIEEEKAQTEDKEKSEDIAENEGSDKKEVELVVDTMDTNDDDNL